MKALRFIGPVVILLFGVVGLVVSSSFKKEPAQSASIQQSALVEVARVQDCQGGFTVSADGEVIPYRQINLSAEVGGLIANKSANARAGNFIREGDQLFKIDRRDYEIEVRRLREIVKQAGSSIEELAVEKDSVTKMIALAEEQLELRQRDVKRFEDLRKKNASSASQLESIRQTELQALNSLQTLNNQNALIVTRRQGLNQERERAIAGLDQAELDLERTIINSPINGVVIRDFVEQGERVQDGTQLIQVEDTSKVEVRFSLRMEQLRWLWTTAQMASNFEPSSATRYTYELPKLPVEVRVEMDGNHFVWPARLDRYDGAGITAGTRTVPIIAVVEDPTAVHVRKDSDILPMASPPTLLRGSYVTVDIPVGNNMNLVSIPTAAFQPNKTVWVFEDGTPRDGKLRIQRVKVAYSDQKQVVVLTAPSQLAVNDLVITSPLSIAENGMAIRLTDDAAHEKPNVENTITARDDETSSESL